METSIAASNPGPFDHNRAYCRIMGVCDGLDDARGLNSTFCPRWLCRSGLHRVVFASLRHARRVT
jgi:hypothetical protein